MIHCPKCNEVIGDDVHKCPFCRHEITEEERRNIAKEKEMANWEATIEAMEEYSRRMRNGFLTWLILMGIAIAGSLIIVFCGLGTFWVFLLIALIIAVGVICAAKWHIGDCPYCEMPFYSGGRHSGGDVLFRNYCPNCGGRLR